MLIIMLPYSELFPQAIPFLLLSITIIIAFKNDKLWPYALGITVASALVFNAIDLSALFVILGTLTLAFFSHKANSQENHTPIAKFMMSSLVVITCLALTAHLLPGFNNLQVLSEVTKNEQSIPFNLHLNFDKPLIIFVLLLILPSILKPRKPIVVLKIGSTFRLFLTVTLGFMVIFILAMALSLINYAPQIPSWWWVFALNNLLLTCVVEEVLFRGFVQYQLGRLITPLAGLILTSLLFGVAHFSGGVSYVFVASIAGFIYGLIYLKTGKLWPAILAHFILNMIHLFLFTYPLSK